jgi:hypothetical protein
MAEIAAMAERIVKKAKEYDRDTIPATTPRWHTPCPQLRRRGQGELPPLCLHRAAGGSGEGCGFSITKIPAGRTFERRGRAFLRDKQIGPLEGFRSKAGWPFTAELALVRDERSPTGSWSSTSATRPAPSRPARSSICLGQPSLGACPKCKVAKKAAARKTPASPTDKAPRAGNLQPSAPLAAVIGAGPFGRGEVMKKLWDYIKAHNLQDPQDKRSIVADDKLRPVLGADRVGMFKLAGIVSGHLS